MLKYIKIKNHKALKEAQLSEVGNINIICGKNNSGKTTILEALIDDKCYSLGKAVDDIEWMMSLFQQQAKRYTTPDPVFSIEWFRKFINNQIENKSVWYSNEIAQIINILRQSQKEDQHIGNYSNDTFNFEIILNKYFEKTIANYKPILIPPKRQLEYIAQINLNSVITPSGRGILNKLFYLKNQDLESEEYKIYKNIYDIFYNISGSRFNIVPNTNNEILILYYTNKLWIPASDSGLGLSDLLIIISVLNIFPENVCLLEEPENHLHAEYQKRLLNYFSQIKSKQFFISTHSHILLDSNLVDKIYYCTNDGEIRLSDQTSKSEIIKSLGYSVTENLVADAIILLEGPTDIPVIQEMLNWVGVNSEHNIKYWPLCGDVMSSLDLSVFKERNNIFALIDSDPGSHVQRTRFIVKCNQNEIYCKKLERYSIENYFSLSAIKKEFPKQIPSSITVLAPNESVDSQIGFKLKEKTIKSKNYNIVKNMKLSDIEGTDLHIFLFDIKKYLTSDNSSL
jgi:AAA15 family ATPase/GTPase